MPFHDLISTHTQPDVETDHLFRDVAKYVWMSSARAEAHARADSWLTRTAGRYFHSQS